MRISSFACVAGTLFFSWPALAAPPVVDSLSPDALAQSGRIEIRGAGFGSLPAAAGSRVEIGGVAAATASWADDRIVAYASAGVPLGSQQLQVITAEGASNAIAISIDPLPASSGDVAWTFLGDGRWTSYAPAVGPDGTVYASDEDGFIYAIEPSGLVRWIRHGPTAGATPEFSVGFANEGPVAVGNDGTIYVAVDLLGPETQLQAWTPEGALLWIHREQNYFSHGAAVAPDGNVVIAVRGAVDGGVRMIAPDGTVVARHDDRLTLDTFRTSGDVAFAASSEDGPIDHFVIASEVPASGVQFSYGTLRAYGLDGELLWVRDSADSTYNPGYGYRDFNVLAAPSGRIFQAGYRYPTGAGLHGFDAEGEHLWLWPEPQDAEPSIPISEPTLGPDGTLYLVNQIHAVVAFDEDGTRLWQRSLDGHTNHAPALHPSGAWVVVPLETGSGLVLQAVETGGRLGWEIELPAVEGKVVSPSDHVAFAADGARAYLAGTFIPNDSRWVLLAIDTPAEPDSGSGGTAGAGGAGGSGGAPGTGGNSGAGASGGTGGGGTNAADGDGTGCASAGAGAAGTALPFGALVPLCGWWRAKRRNADAQRQR